MPGKLRSKLSYANVTATLALFVALGGSAYAGLRIGSAEVVDGSILGRDIAKETITGRNTKTGTIDGSDIRDGSLLTADIARTAREAIKGEKGEKGDKGDSAADLWAVIHTDGTVARSKGLAGVQRLATGRYSVRFNQDVTGCAFLAAVGDAESGNITPGQALVTKRVGDGNAVQVTTTVADGSQDGDRDFHLGVFC